jgi:hypothetical protein
MSILTVTGAGFQPFQLSVTDTSAGHVPFMTFFGADFNV